MNPVGKTPQTTGSKAMADALELYRLTSPAMQPHTDRQLSAESAATAYSSATPSQQGVPGAGRSDDAAAPCLTKPAQPASTDVTVPQSSDDEDEEPVYSDGLATAVVVHRDDRAPAARATAQARRMGRRLRRMIVLTGGFPMGIGLRKS